METEYLDIKDSSKLQDLFILDKNTGNSRKLIPLQRQFDSQKNELDKTLKTLYNLGEGDKLIPLISEIYAIN